MSKKTALVALAAVFVLAMLTVASAKPNVADTTKKGSLLVFPKVEVFKGDLVDDHDGSDGRSGVDTFIFIGNDNVVPVSIKCYWMDNNQTIEDFQFTITPNQPVFFSAATGGGDGQSLTVPPFSGVGSLVCFAVEDSGAIQKKFNHLYGNAMIVSPALGGTQAAMYNAYSFANPGSVGNPGQLQLDGVSYDACPQYLVTDFIAATDNETQSILPSPPFYRPDLSLWPCIQDLRQDRTPTCTKAKFDVWNANEIKFTGAYQCLKCFYEGFLDEIGRKNHVAHFSDGDNTQRGPGFGWDKFVRNALRTDVARFRVQGVASTVCDNKIRGCPSGPGVTKATPFLGVLLYAEDLVGATVNNAKIVAPLTGSTLFGAGLDNTGSILWDFDALPPQAPKK